MNKIKIIMLLIFYLFLSVSCSKINSNYPPSESYLTAFDSLIVQNDTIHKGEVTVVTAFTTGHLVRYSWTANVGPIMGDGHQVTYLASPCCNGNVVITCEARGFDQSLTKLVVITVLP